MRGLILAFLLFSGCAALGSWTDAQAKCASDAECLAKVKGYAKIGEVVTSPFGPIAGAGAMALISYLGLGILGRKRGKAN